MQKEIDKLLFSTAPELLQFNVIYDFLTHSYWSEGISEVRMKRAIGNSLNVGVYLDGKQVAYSRLVTDHATFVYLCDVFVLPEQRGLGISKKMMEFIHELPEIQGFKRFLLATKDAHGLYTQFGFSPLKTPEMYLEINRSGIFKTLDE